MRRIILLFAALLLASSSFAGGGWNAGKNKGFFKLGQSAIVANAYFTPTGEIIDITTISMYTTSLYGEYGLGPRFDVIGYLPFYTRATLNEINFTSGAPSVPGDAINSVGDAIIGFKYGLKQDGPWVWSASVQFGLPLGKTANGARTESGEPRIIETGDGEFNQLFRIDASHSFYPSPAYLNLYVGVNNRTENFSDEFRAGIQLGYQFSEKVSGSLRLDNVTSFQNGDPAGNGANSVFSNNTEYFSFTPELGYHLNEAWGISASGGFAFSAKRILAAPIWEAGVFFKLN